MDINQIHKVYFIGIGGIGMSALARYFKLMGKDVQGYDLVPSDLTDELVQEEIPVVFDANISVIPESFKTPLDTLVVFTPAVPEDLPILQWFRENGFRVYKRSRVLGLITKAKNGICVAGTHGKTTVSTMIGHLLTESEVGCSAFLGGISRNYQSNLLVSTKSEYVVVEADEFDRSFHQLSPNIGLITSLDADHLDIYGTKEALKEAFQIFSSLISHQGILVVKDNIDFEPKVKDDVKVYSYGFSESADYRSQNIRLEDGLFVFDFKTPNGVLKDLKLGVPGRVNLENATAALTVALITGVKEEEVRKSLLSFAGIWRRFEHHIRTEDLVYIDDYAHHPEEIHAALRSARELYPNKKLSVIFQPHLFSRTQDFAPEFAERLALADEVILLDIYPARELPVPGVTSELIFNSLQLDNKYLIKKDELIPFLADKKYELIMSLGAGDIGAMTKTIKQTLQG